jgi:hypothetical protein
LEKFSVMAREQDLGDAGHLEFGQGGEEGSIAWIDDNRLLIETNDVRVASGSPSKHVAHDFLEGGVQGGDDKGKGDQRPKESVCCLHDSQSISDDAGCEENAIALETITKMGRVLEQSSFWEPENRSGWPGLSREADDTGFGG